MQEELAELMAGMQTARLVNEVHVKWRTKAIEFIVNQNLHQKPHLIDQVLIVCDEAAKTEMDNIADNMQKLQAILELEQVKEKQKENGVMAAVN